MRLYVRARHHYFLKLCRSFVNLIFDDQTATSTELSEVETISWAKYTQWNMWKAVDEIESDMDLGQYCLR